jgi:parallel beta-helix repeat protein
MKRTRVLVVLMVALLLLPGWGRAQTARFSIADYGAVSDGKTNNAASIDRAIAAAAHAGGGTVVVPPGDYMSGPITILSNVTLYLEAGSMIRGSNRLEDYMVAREGGDAASAQGSNTQPAREPAGLITATGAKNIAITGRGTIEGSAVAFMKADQVLDLKYAVTDGGDWSPRLVRQGKDFLSTELGPQDGPYVPIKPRPGRMIQINKCDNVMITGVMLQNSPNYTVSVTDSRNVDIIGIKINSFASNRRAPNDDGIDLFNSRFVHISDCDIQNGDDSLCLFGSEDVTVTNCTLSSHDSAIRIGYDGGETRNSVFSNLVIRKSTRGINVNVRAGGVIENLLFNNIAIETQLHTGYWWGKGEPIHISAVPQAGTKVPGIIRNLRFSNILADSEAGILIYGTKESVIRDIQFDRVKLKVKAGPMTEFVGGNFDLRGNVPQELSIFKHDIPALYARYVDGLKLSNFEVEWESQLPEFFSHGIECENFRNLQVDGFSGRQAKSESKNSAISLSNGSGVTIRDSVAAEGTQTFLAHTGVTGGIVLLNNDLSRTKVVISPAKAELTQSGNIMPTRKARE